jgi:hypothetical protein
VAADGALLPAGPVGVREVPVGPLVAPATALGPVAFGVAAPGLVVLGAPAPGVVVSAGGATVAGGVTAIVVAVVVESNPPASFISARASTPIESAPTTAIATIGALQFADVANRVRAAAPQRRHHSCSG